MDKTKSNFYFKAMVLSFKLRDLLSPRENVLKEANIKSGFRVLDYGCGTGSYIRGTAELVGKSGKVYAVDIHPRAIQRVANIASAHNLTNVESIQTDCKTGLPGQSVDTALLYDAFHDLSEPEKVLEELHRLLKPNGTLSFSDHHIKESKIISRVTKSGLFKLSSKGKKTYTFAKEQ